MSSKTAKNETLPKEWREVKLEDACHIIVSPVDKKTIDGELPVRLCNYTDVYYNNTIDSEIDFMAATAKPLEIEKFSIIEGDVIITKDSETPDDIGVPAYVKETIDNLLCGYHLAILRPKDQATGKYICYALTSPRAKYNFYRFANGITRFGLTTKSYQKIKIPLPPLYEQKAIASLLETWDTAIEKTEALIAAKEKQFKWLLKTLISDQQGNNGWQKVRLNTVASVKTGPFGAQLHQHDYVQYNGTPIVTVEHLSERGLIHENLPLVSYHDKQRLSQYLIREGDIVFSRVGSVDRSALVSKDEDGWLFSGRLLRVRPKRCDVYSSYLNYFFHTRKFRHHMKSIAVGGTMPSINTNILSNVTVHLPSMDEQKAIASLLETWDTAIEKTKVLAEQYRTQKRGLMQKLLTGKWRIPIKDD